MKNLTINVGDYVRTKEGLIFKVININDFREPSMRYGIEANYFDDVKFIGDEYLEKVGFKSSPNIIDLIEEFDYIKMNDWGSIKFWRVVKTPYGKLMFEDDGWNELEDFDNEEISEIITHEQLESIAYKVGE